MLRDQQMHGLIINEITSTENNAW
jgi:ABC-type transport system involved in cytochrome bd biosynthesis fused ATPase/permease subunit